MIVYELHGTSRPWGEPLAACRTLSIAADLAEVLEDCGDGPIEIVAMRRTASRTLGPCWMARR